MVEDALYMVGERAGDSMRREGGRRGREGSEAVIDAW